MGSDKPTPRGPVEALMDDTSGVVAKELMDETDDALLLGGEGDIGPQRFQPGSFYRYANKHRSQKESVAGCMGYGMFATSPALEFSALHSDTAT